MMKIIKRKLIFCLLFIFSLLFLFGCEINSDSVRLPDLEGMTRDEIDQKLKGTGLKYIYFVENRMYKYSFEYDQFIKYGQDLKAGSMVKKNSTIYIYTTALNLPKENVAEVTMDFEYEGKSFIDDGVGKVTLVRCVDGDTAHFIDSEGRTIKLRFLGINTPESTIEKDPWGKAASEFTKNILENAKEIVLEAEGNPKDIYDRYLGFVWADGVLVNLLLVQNAYSNSKLSSNSKYFEPFYETELVISKTGRRVYGEIDPGYDYENGRFK